MEKHNILLLELSTSIISTTTSYRHIWISTVDLVPVSSDHLFEWSLDADAA